ncbi:hypothetical protein QTP88_011986 [Uroleucon formosanum]
MIRISQVIRSNDSIISVISVISVLHHILFLSLDIDPGPDPPLSPNLDNDGHNDVFKPPPPIFVRGVTNYSNLTTAFIELIGVDNFFCKASADRLKIQTANPESYRSLIHFLKDEGAEYHTYQLKEDKPLRVVIRNLHHTTEPDTIKEELVVRMFDVRRVTNVLHRVTKAPLPLFFVDLEPQIKSNEIFQLTSLLHTKIRVEEPYKSKILSQCINCQEYDLNSDHSSVILTLNASPPLRPISPKLFNRTTNKLQFHELVDQRIKLNVKLKSKDDLDSAVNNFTNIIQSSAWSSSKQTTPPSNLSPMPAHIREVIVQKRRARAHYQRSRLPSHKQMYNKLSNSLKKLLAKHKSNSFTSYLTNLSPTDGSLWRATKNVCKTKTPNIPIKKPDGSLAVTDSDKTEAFKQHLSDIFVPHSDIFCPHNINSVEEFLNIPLPACLPVKHFTPNEVKYTIDKYPLKKSPGFDLITAEVARCLPKKAIIHLTHIFNSVLRLSYFPILWKYSIIILVPKPNKPPDSISSFRPISLLPFFAKILERLLLKRILPSLTTNSVLPDYQFGFRSAHSTIHQAHRVVDSISFALEKKSYCTCTFLDISQAFDRVWHDGLLFKLKKFLHPVYFLIIKSYLSDRYFSTRIGDTLSSIARISAGVPQGGILSPVLYNIYASDQPITPHTQVADYADDKVIISISPEPITASSHLQNHLTLMEDWYTKWRLKINQSKSVHTTFTLRLSPCPAVSIYGTQIPNSQTVKYLGLTLDRRLTWAQHTKLKRLNLNSRFRLLKSFINNNTHTNLNTKLIIYKSLIKPVWTYGIQLWGNAKKSNINKIQTFQNLALRKLLNAPPYVSNSTIHSDLKMKTVHEEAKIHYKRFHSRLSSNPNPLIRDIAVPTIPGNPPRRLKRSWCRDLLVPPL